VRGLERAAHFENPYITFIFTDDASVPVSHRRKRQAGLPAVLHLLAGRVALCCAQAKFYVNGVLRHIMKNLQPASLPCSVGFLADDMNGGR
jgi:hypothetical protein